MINYGMQLIGKRNYVAMREDLAEGKIIPFMNESYEGDGPYLQIDYAAFQPFFDAVDKELREVDWKKIATLLEDSNIPTPPRIFQATKTINEALVKLYPFLGSGDPGRIARHEAFYENGTTPETAVLLSDTFKKEAAMCPEVAIVASEALHRAGLDNMVVYGAIKEPNGEERHFFNIIKHDSGVTLYDPSMPRSQINDHVAPALYTIAHEEYESWVTLAEKGHLVALRLTSDFDSTDEVTRHYAFTPSTHGETVAALPTKSLPPAAIRFPPRPAPVPAVKEAAKPGA